MRHFDQLSSGCFQKQYSSRHFSHVIAQTRFPCWMAWLIHRNCRHTLVLQHGLIRRTCNVAFHLSWILEFENEIPVMRQFHNTTCKKNLGLGGTYHLHGEKGEILFGNKTVWKASENTAWLEPIYCFYCFLISFFLVFFLSIFSWAGHTCLYGKFFDHNVSFNPRMFTRQFFNRIRW